MEIGVDFRTFQLLEALGSDGLNSDRERAKELSREREIVCWVARPGAVSVEQIGRRFSVGRSVAYQQVRRLIGYGLLERTRTGIGDPTLISATRDGITYEASGSGGRRSASARSTTGSPSPTSRSSSRTVGCSYVVPPSTPTQQVVNDAIRRVSAEDEVRVLELGRPLR